MPGLGKGGGGERQVSEASSSKTIKITVQFETERNGQNEIVSHMDRSEVKL